MVTYSCGFTTRRRERLSGNASADSRLCLCPDTAQYAAYRIQSWNPLKTSAEIPGAPTAASVPSLMPILPCCHLLWLRIPAPNQHRDAAGYDRSWPTVFLLHLATGMATSTSSYLIWQYARYPRLPRHGGTSRTRKPAGRPTSLATEILNPRMANSRHSYRRLSRGLRPSSALPASSRVDMHNLRTIGPEQDSPVHAKGERSTPLLINTHHSR
ncbi:hypothetical protein F4802DRAFT_378149 [Xylaria palmicola]|nr:hypothetical protein F4802DRAFT_378149 [Xylaria palmicola]